MFTLVFTRRFSMAHRLLGPDAGKCDVPHGHNEIVRVHLEATAPAPLDGDANMVASFEDAKHEWHAWIDRHVDHSFQLSETDPLIGYFRDHEPDKLAHILTTPGDPTTEIVAALFMSKINAMLMAGNTGLRCRRIELEETPTNAVTLEGSAGDVLPERSSADAGGDRWWRRADISINDLS